MVTDFKKIVKIFIVPLILISGLINYGCSPASILATGGSGAMVVAEGERSLGTVIDDATIKVNIAAKFLNLENNLFVNINTSILEKIGTFCIKFRKFSTPLKMSIYTVKNSKSVDAFSWDCRSYPKRNKHKSCINQPRFNSAIDFRPSAVFTLTKVNEKQRLAHGGFELA